MANICLLRHGQTAWNVEGKWQGHTDIGLNETGVFQATHISEALKDQNFEAIYSSDLGRAYTTAEIINRHHNLTIIKDERLREQNLGNWEGLYVNQIPDLFPGEWEIFSKDPINTRINGGESVRDLADRMVEIYQQINRDYPNNVQVLVVAHGLSLAVLYCEVNGLHLAEAFNLKLENAKPFFLETPLKLKPTAR
jgi:broad specificity phosphatase PhoE